MEKTCHKCASSACISQWTGQGLCAEHFMHDFEKRMSASVREFGMIEADEHVVVALSGGKDSTVLLHLLARLRKRLPFRLSALLVDEGIKGYRSGTVEVAKKECKKLGVKLTVISFEKELGKKLDEMLKVKKKQGEGVRRNLKLGGGAAPLPAVRRGACTYCGVFRRYLLNLGARRLKADKLALGHNLDDAAQTVLLNLFRGEPGRLARFWPVSDRKNKMEKESVLVSRILPLIRCYEKEIAAWAVLNGIGIKFMSCPYAGEAMRQQVRAMLNLMEEKYPGTKSRLFNSFMKMRPWLKAGAEREGATLGECKTCGEASSKEICAACALVQTLGKRAGGRAAKAGH